jgi:hypothetical protein
MVDGGRPTIETNDITILGGVWSSASGNFVVAGGGSLVVGCRSPTTTIIILFDTPLLVLVKIIKT